MRTREPRAALIATAALLSTAALAAEVRITSQTFLGARQVPADRELLTSIPLIEQIGLTARDLSLPGTEDLEVVVSAWARLDPMGSEALGGFASGDVDLAYAQGRFLHKKLSLRLGRQMVTTGVARMTQLDGLWSTYQHTTAIGATAFFGVPVTPRFGWREDEEGNVALGFEPGDAMGGARVHWRPRYGNELGLSFAHVQDDGRTMRQEVGIDGRWGLARGLAANAAAFLSTTELRLVEAEVNAVWQPTMDLFVTGTYRRTAPDLWISRGSIFSVFSIEERDEVGANVQWELLQGVAIGADGYAFLHEDRYGIRGRLYGRIAPAQRGGPWLGVDLSGGRVLMANDYIQTRFRAGKDWMGSKLYTTGEVELTWLQRPINGQNLSVAGVGTLGYRLGQHLRAQLTAIAGVTPFFTRRMEMMAKVAYDLDVRTGGGEP